MKTRSLALLLTASLASLSQPAWADASKCKVSRLANLPVVMEESRASVAVTVNGHETRVWLDSGAFFNFMPMAKAVEFGLRTEPLPAGFSVTGIGGSFTPQLTTVHDFGFLGTTLHNMQFIVGGSDAGNGFLGANLLGAFDGEFDLAKGTVNLFKESGCNQVNMAYWSKGMTVGEARLLSSLYPSDRHIYVEVTVNGHPLRALLDTGAPISIIGRHAAERAGIDLNAPRVLASHTVGGIGSHVRQSWIARGQTIDIGGEKISNSPIRVIDDGGDDRDHDMLLGVDFLMSHHLFVSQTQHIMYLTYNGGPIFSSTTDDETGYKSTTRGENMGESEKAAEPKTADEFAGRASGRLSTGDAVGAAADFTQAIRLAPTRADLLANRSQAYARSGHPDLAAKDIDAALAITPRDNRLLVRRALIRLRKGDRAGAMTDTDAAAASTPRGSLDAMEVVTLYERLGVPDRGLALIDPVVALHRYDASYPKLLNARSWNRALANADLDRALKDVNLAIKKAGPLPGMLDTRALIRLRLKDYAGTIADETAALDKNSKLAAALFTRGLARLAGGDTAGGDADIAAARTARPGIDRYYAAYGLHAPGAGPATSPQASDLDPDDTQDPDQ